MRAHDAGAKRLSTIGHLLGREIEPAFISMDEVLLIQDELIERYGGLPGVRDLGLLESALHKPMMLACYGGEPPATPAQLAAALALGIIHNHPFNDGNKRAAFFSMAMLLAKNQYDFAPDPQEAVFMVKGAAAGEITDEAFTSWVQRAAQPVLGAKSIDTWRQRDSQDAAKEAEAGIKPRATPGGQS